MEKWKCIFIGNAFIYIRFNKTKIPIVDELNL